eukprot:6173390-Pleurochrysis_carterae.AAC.7
MENKRINNKRMVVIFLSRRLTRERRRVWLEKTLQKNTCHTPHSGKKLAASSECTKQIHLLQHVPSETEREGTCTRLSSRTYALVYNRLSQGTNLQECKCTAHELSADRDAMLGPAITRLH